MGMALGGFLNIGLDAVFVPVLGLGAAGAAIATDVSNVVAFLYLLRVILRNRNTVIVLNRFMGELGLICAAPIADTCALLLGIVLYRVLAREMKE